MPSSRMLAHDLEELLDDHRREAERQLVDHQQPRLRQERHAEGEHLLLAAGQVRRPARRARSRSTGNISSTSLDALARPRRVSRRSSQPAARRFSATVSDGNIALPAGHLHDAARRDLVRRARG